MLFTIRPVATVAVLATATTLLIGGLFAAQAQDESTARLSSAKVMPSKAASYYVDFRVIDGVLYGHTHIAYGRLNARGQPISVNYAGFEPSGGLIAGAIGHIAPVSGSIRTSKESVNFEIIDSYRRKLTTQQYKSLMAAVQTAKKHPSQWNVLFQNCNDFVAAMAHAIGLKAPSNVVLPYVYIAALRGLNQ